MAALEKKAARHNYMQSSTATAPSTVAEVALRGTSGVIRRAAVTAVTLHGTLIHTRREDTTLLVAAEPLVVAN